MYTFIPKPKLPVIVYYTGKHVSLVFEDLRKTKAPNNVTHTNVISVVGGWTGSAKGWVKCEGCSMPPIVQEYGTEQGQLQGTT